MHLHTTCVHEPARRSGTETAENIEYIFVASQLHIHENRTPVFEGQSIVTVAARRRTTEQSVFKLLLEIRLHVCARCVCVKRSKERKCVRALCQPIGNFELRIFIFFLRFLSNKCIVPINGVQRTVAETKRKMILDRVRSTRMGANCKCTPDVASINHAKCLGVKLHKVSRWIGSQCSQSIS